MRITNLQHRFVDFVPEGLEPGVLYIALEYGAIAHLCGCGCGSEIATPLGPTDWKMTYDGESVSLHPSVGNWSLPCRSHYVIRSGKVIWAAAWDDEMIAAGRARDRSRKDSYFGQGRPVRQLTQPPTKGSASNRSSWRARLKSWLSW